MTSKWELEGRIRRMVDKAAAELLEFHPPGEVQILVERFRNLARRLDYSTYKRSAALYVSPREEKVIHFDIPVEETVLVDEGFDVRQIVRNKRKPRQFLAVEIHEMASRVFLCVNDSATLIASNSAERFQDSVSPAGHRGAHPEASFLRHVDNVLDILLKAYGLPLFVLGSETVCHHFRELTRHTHRILAFVPGRFGSAAAVDIQVTLEPFVSDWNKVREKDILLQLEAARHQGRLSEGIAFVYREAARGKGKLLVLEQDRRYMGKKITQDRMAYWSLQEMPGASRRELSGEIIEAVLRNGGDVEFVSKHVLREFQDIALIY